MHRQIITSILHAWQTLSPQILADPHELHRRLQRRANIFNRVPRPLCLAIRASDRRINNQTAALSPLWATHKGAESEHDVLLTASLIRHLCRPVELSWRLRFSHVAQSLGSNPQLPRQLERRNHFRAHRIPGLGGNWRSPYPLIESDYPAFLDPGHWGKSAPDEHLLAFWQELGARLPSDIHQTLRRTPHLRNFTPNRRMLTWLWICPACNRNVHTLYFPMGFPDLARIHDLKLPTPPWFIPPSQPGAFACKHCHHVFTISRTEKSISAGWGNLIKHLSGGLLFGHEVPRPASFSINRKRHYNPAPRATPRSDELEHYLATTNLPMRDIARAMNHTLPSTRALAVRLYKKRHLKGGRPALKAWWTNNRPATHNLHQAA